MILKALTAFNLVCTGTMTSEPDTHVTGSSVTYRVDLRSRQFCFHVCVCRLRIARVTRDELVLLDGPEGDEMHQYESVNRSTLRWFSRSIVGPELSSDVRTTEVGRCRLAPFTGFPRKSRLRG